MSKSLRFGGGSRLALVGLCAKSGVGAPTAPERVETEQPEARECHGRRLWDLRIDGAAKGEPAVAVLDRGVERGQEGAVQSDRMEGVVLGGGGALLIPAVFTLLLLVLIGLVALLTRSGGAERRAAPPWLCGYADEAESNRYRAAGMYGEFKRYFAWVGGAPVRTGVRAAPRPRGGGGAGKVS